MRKSRYASLTTEDVEEIKARHADRMKDPCGLWPCDALRLVRKIEEMREEAEDRAYDMMSEDR